jgi:acyl carrier protein/short-subunit dehydrogenase
MAKQGVRHLVLLGRRGVMSDEAQRGVEQLQHIGVNVVVEKVDVTKSQQVAEVLIRIRQTMPPLRGVVHGAMVLDDSTILQQDRDRFHKVLAPKAWGAWHLHQHTLADHLDFFVLFSSFTAIVGNPGQASYVAANAFLDALAHFRRQKGLPALSVNWGPLEDVGYVADNPKVAAHLTQLGAKSLSSHTMLHLLGLLLGTQETQVAVAHVKPGFWVQLQASGALPRLSQLLSDSNDTNALTTTSGSVSLRDQLNASSPEEREVILISAVRSQLAKILGMRDPQQIDVEQDFFDGGLDSLMAVELEMHLESLLGCSLPQTALLDHPTISRLVHYLLHDVLRMSTEATGIPADGERTIVVAVKTT